MQPAAKSYMLIENMRFNTSVMSRGDVVCDKSIFGQKFTVLLGCLYSELFTSGYILLYSY